MKHAIICIGIILFVIIVDIFTQSYTEESVAEITDKLDILKQDILNDENIEVERIEEITKKWDERYDILAYYLEHDELEKVKTELVSLDASLRMEEYGQAVADINRGVFLLEHIKQKTALQIKNIF